MCGRISGNVDIYTYRCVDIYSVCGDLYMGYLYVCNSYVCMYMYIHRGRDSLRMHIPWMCPHTHTHTYI